MTKKTILVVGDFHARPQQHNKRATILGRFIRDKQPDIVVQIGDFGDFGSLSTYDKGTYHSEGRRYSQDLSALGEALDLIDKELKGMRKRPEMYVTLGNHEDRITRATIASPELYGHIGLGDIPFETYGWKVIPFLVPLCLQGITFQHYFTRGNMGRPIGDERTVLRSQHVSCVYGHDHIYRYFCELNGHKKKIFAIDVGCFDEGKHHYTREQSRWDPQLTMIHEAKDGYGSVTNWQLGYLKRKYL